MMNPPYAMSNEGSNADASTRMASKIRIFEAARAKKTATTPTSKCMLLDLLPPELRNIVWKFVIEGDCRIIQADLQHHNDLATRLAITFTCRRIREETRSMFLPNNGFLFVARDDLMYDDVLENLADWLNYVKDDEIEKIGRIVVCTEQEQDQIEYAWAQTGEMGMDSGFVVGDRIDTRIGALRKNSYGFDVSEYSCWGLEDGHHCNKKHYEMVLPRAEANKAVKKLEKEEIARRAYKGELAEERAYEGVV